MAALGWLLNLGFAGGVAVTEHTILLDGECLMSDTSGVEIDCKRLVRAVLTPGDAAVNYVFEETEVS